MIVYILNLFYTMYHSKKVRPVAPPISKILHTDLHANELITKLSINSKFDSFCSCSSTFLDRSKWFIFLF